MKFLGVVAPLSSTINDFIGLGNCSPIGNNSERDKLVDIEHCSDLVHAILGSCHSLFISGNELAGDVLEIESMMASGFLFGKIDDFDTVVNRDLDLKIVVKKRHQFSSSLKRMSVVVNLQRLSKIPMNCDVVFVKGAPEV